MARLFIHAGMHKTGSSSIQATLAALSDDRRPAFLFLGKSGNASGAAREAFQDRTRFHAGRGVVHDDPRAISAATRAQIAQTLAAAAGADAIVSGEGISALTLPQFREFMALVRHGDVAITAYARQPYDLLPSQMQQRIKGGRLMSGRGQLSLRYHFACRKFFRWPFTLKRYDRAVLRNNCVVQDYFFDVGIVIKPEEVVNQNERLGRAATALLCARNLWRIRRGMVIGDNRFLVPSLRQIVGPRFELHPEVIRRAIAEQTDEVGWMVKKLGSDWIVEPEPTANHLRTEADLFAFGEEAQAWLAANDPDYVRSDDPEAVGEAVERICARIRTDLRAARRAGATADPQPVS